MAVVWTVVQLERDTSNDGVVVAHWRASDSETDSDDVVHTGQSYGTCSFSPDPESESWVDFADITEDMAVGWVKDCAQITVSDIEASIANQIAESKAPSVVAEVPW